MMLPIDIVAPAAIVSFAVSLLIVLTQRWHGKHSLDNDTAGVQKVHTTPVPRIGGIAIMAGMLAVSVLMAAVYPIRTDDASTGDLFKLLLAAAPALLTGLIEDLTKRISVKARLLATFASAFLASWLLGAYLPRLDIWGIDQVLQVMPIAIVFTAFAVAGVANSINIIDGFNGLAGFAVIIILAGLGFLSWQSGDMFVTHLALTGIGAMLGFLLVNYPTGRLFLGDGGAYLAGFWVAEVAVLLVARNPSVSACQVFAVCAYPVIEVMYSIYRRKFIRKSSPGAADGLHLHTLVYRRVICQLVPRNDDRPWIRNALVACFVTTAIAITTFTAVRFGDTFRVALLVVTGEVLLYMAVYARLVRGHWCMNPIVALGLRPEAGIK
jgi:UDP-N-acetylmuramyl pentapeptide phosphotransferase/UDP-N-acetylglucosamine-1-phosphate transferase